MKEDHIIYGVHITDRLQRAVEVQKLLTEYGHHIKTRLGLHEVGNGGSPGGILLLEMWGEAIHCQELRDKLNQIEGVEVKEMVFAHD